MTADWHLAIDFGTSNTAAAHTSASSGDIETLALTHQGNLMPSAVYVDDNGIYVGYSAFNHAAARPDAFLGSPKRVIEHSTVTLGGKQTQTSMLVAAVLARVVQIGKSQHNDQPPTTVTLTHPEAWSHHAISNLKAGAQAAGISMDDLHLISEPRAAARFYSESQPVAAGDRVAVFDFGGGTLDIAVLEADASGDFRVVAARGDNSLGGRNVDTLIRKWVITQLEDENPALATYLQDAPSSVNTSLDHSIRTAKEILSDTPSATVTVSTPEGETNLLLTREEFNDLLVTDIDRAVALTRATLRDAGADKGITTMYLTGGSSRIPYVQDRLGEVAQVARLDDPKTVVARGALYSTMKQTEGAASTAAVDDPFAGIGGGTAAGGAAAAAMNSGNDWGVANSNADEPEPQTQGGLASARLMTPPTSQPSGTQPMSAFGAPGAGMPNNGASSNGVGTNQGSNSADAYRSAMGDQQSSNPYGAPASTKKSGSNKGLVFAGVGAVALLAIGGGAYALTSGGEETPPEETSTEAAPPKSSAPQSSTAPLTTTSSGSDSTNTPTLPAEFSSAFPAGLLEVEYCSESSSFPITYDPAPAGSALSCSWMDESRKDTYQVIRPNFVKDQAAVQGMIDELKSKSSLYEVEERNEKGYTIIRKSLEGGGYSDVVVAKPDEGLAVVATSVTTAAAADQFVDDLIVNG
ncbi:Hsp70 family protein [Corynebacterium sp. H113]|uniref:Hsp70 family protein n=1 Tax=Corynebacterium sp. H113 TaxID=3133419 RepID=UPI0030A8F247